MNILFYSHKCDTSKNLLLLLKNENLLGYFKLICVDDKLDKLPPQITIVPTMIVANINKPLVVQEAFEWVKQIKFLRQQQVMDINKKIIQQNDILVNNKKGPIGYDNEIMAGISDKFAFTKIDNPLPHSYFNLGEEDKNAIFTAPEQNRINKNEQYKLIKDIELRRNQQDNDYTIFTKQQQINAVLKAEEAKLMTQNVNPNNVPNNFFNSSNLDMQQMHNIQSQIQNNNRR